MHTFPNGLFDSKILAAPVWLLCFKSLILFKSHMVPWSMVNDTK